MKRSKERIYQSVCLCMCICFIYFPERPSKSLPIWQLEQRAYDLDSSWVGICEEFSQIYSKSEHNHFLHQLQVQGIPKTTAEGDLLGLTEPTQIENTHCIHCIMQHITGKGYRLRLAKESSSWVWELWDAGLLLFSLPMHLGCVPFPVLTGDSYTEYHVLGRLFQNSILRFWSSIPWAWLIERPCGWSQVSTGWYHVP